MGLFIVYLWVLFLDWLVFVWFLSVMSFYWLSLVDDDMCYMSFVMDYGLLNFVFMFYVCICIYEKLEVGCFMFVVKDEYWCVFLLWIEGERMGKICLFLYNNRVKDEV